MAGFNQESNAYKMMKASRTDMINEDLPSLSQATGDYKNSDEFEEYHVRGVFYRINYSYAGKYYSKQTGVMMVLRNSLKKIVSASFLLFP